MHCELWDDYSDVLDKLRAINAANHSYLKATYRNYEMGTKWYVALHKTIVCNIGVRMGTSHYIKTRAAPGDCVVVSSHYTATRWKREFPHLDVMAMCNTVPTSAPTVWFDTSDGMHSVSFRTDLVEKMAMSPEQTFIFLS